MALIHVAGAPEGRVQRCIRCGLVLIDRTGEMSLLSDGAAIFWWDGNVGVDGGHSWSTVEPSTCSLERVAAIQAGN
jgi:hypothetical protein